MATDLQQGLGQSSRSRIEPSGIASSGMVASRRDDRRSARRRRSSRKSSERIAQGLGWFSVGLGLAELLAPQALEALTGLERRRPIVRLFGLREIVAGIGLLTQPRRAAWLWARAAGDVMDLALLAGGLANTRGRGRAIGALLAVGGITALDVMVARQLTHAGAGSAAAECDFLIEQSIAVMKSPEECYRFWRDLENLPGFMPHLLSVQALDERRSRWIARGPLHKRLEWTAELSEDRPNERLAWRTVEGEEISHSGTVHFEAAPAERGTIVRVLFHYSPVGGSAAVLLSELLGQSPQGTVREDLRRFKQMLEAGEVPTTRGQPTGRRSLLGRTLSSGRFA